MSGDECRNVWREAGRHDKAMALDAAFPNCFCEPWSLVADERPAVAPDEPMARILTTPGSYQAGEILTQKLTAAWAGGVSVIRAGASEAEIKATIDQLVNHAADSQTLLGAVVFRGIEIASFGAGDRHFGAYHTPDGEKSHHADILATMPLGTNSQKKRIQSERRRALRDFLQPRIIFEGNEDELIVKLREEGL